MKSLFCQIIQLSILLSSSKQCASQHHIVQNNDNVHEGDTADSITSNYNHLPALRELQTSQSLAPSNSPTAAPFSGIDFLPGLETNFAGVDQMDGNMFDIVAFGSLFLVAMQIHAADTILEVDIYTRTGSHNNRERRPGAWTQITDSLAIHGMGYGVQTNIPIGSFAPIALYAGDRRAFFVSLNNVKKAMYCSNVNNNMFDVAARNDYLQILVGVGNRYGFANTYDGYVWNGALIYTTTDGMTLALVEDALELYNKNNVDADADIEAQEEGVMAVSSSSGRWHGSSSWGLGVVLVWMVISALT